MPTAAFELAGLVFSFASDEAGVFELLERRFSGFEASRDPDWRLEIETTGPPPAETLPATSAFNERLEVVTDGLTLELSGKTVAATIHPESRCARVRRMKKSRKSSPGRGKSGATDTLNSDLR